MLDNIGSLINSYTVVEKLKIKKMCLEVFIFLIAVSLKNCRMLYVRMFYIYMYYKYKSASFGYVLNECHARADWTWLNHAFFYELKCCETYLSFH